MSEETPIETPEQPAEKTEDLIMCYISKKMVPMSETVEVAYGQNKKYRVLPEFIRY